MKYLRTLTLLALLVGAMPAVALETKSTPQENPLGKLFDRALAQVADLFPSYLTRAPAERLLAAAVNGILRELDPSGHSHVYKREKPQGESLVSPAITVKLADGVPAVSSVIVHSDSFVKGVHQGDLLLRVDDKLVLGRDLQPIEARLAGAPGSLVKLGLLRRESNTYHEIAVKREAMPSVVFSRPLGATLAYVEINHVDDRTVAEFEAKLPTLAKSKLAGLILDLRNTGGGTVEHAARLANAFLPGEGKIVCKVTSTQGTRSVTSSAKTSSFKVPTVVLVDHGTSGAAEIAAAALQDNRRAILLGLKTSGQGSFLADAELSSDYGLKVISSLVVSPSGKEIAGHGLAPDIEQVEETVPANASARYHEEYTAFCKAVKTTAASVKSTPGTTETTEAAAPPPEEDEEERPAEPGKPKGPEGPLDDYPLVKRYDAQLVRAMNLLISTNIFFEQVLSNE